MAEEAMSKDTREQPFLRLSAEHCDGQILCPCILSNANGTVVVASHDTSEKSLKRLSHFSVSCLLFSFAFDLDISLSMP